MAIEIRDFDPRDSARLAEYSIAGMHFDQYMSSRLALSLYGRFFVAGELVHASQAIAAYEDGSLAGALFADIAGEPHPYRTWPRRLFVGAVGLAARHAEASYHEACRDMLASYTAGRRVDGEICLLAADPRAKGKGIGTLLLDELVRREAGRHVYLYTDSNCTYQFYEHRGFERVGERAIGAGAGGRGMPRDCYLYARDL